MIYRLAVEAMEPDHAIAHVLELPGCFSSARTQAQAAAGAPAHIAAYFQWCAGRGRPSPKAGEPIEAHVVEVFHSFPAREDPDYIVNAFFEDDSRALAADEVDFGLWFLEHSRRDLMETLSRFKPDQFTRTVAAGPKDTLERILSHVAHAEWWYFDRLGMAAPADWRELADDPLARLEQVRLHSRDTLPKLAGDSRITTRVDERWSARKVLRRMLWHERDHTQQIASIDPAGL